MRHVNEARENPYAIYLLFTYSVPVLLIFLYPVYSLLISSIEKFSPIIIDLFIFTGILSYCVTIYFVFEGARSDAESESLYLPLAGQVNFLLGMYSTFSYHTSYITTLLRNAAMTLVLTIALYYIDTQFFFLNGILIVQGVFLGTVMSWIFYETMRQRFYLQSTDADARQHLYNQLSKLVYPHQLERIKLGDELENTMPLKEGKAIINVFDVQKSSEIRHERTQEFFMAVFQSFLQICMKGYEHNPLRSRAFRLKETGDGFISSVGYPFLPVDSHSLADSAVATALDMFEAFNKEVEKFNYSRPIKGAMGLAYNSVQGTFQSGGIRSYDLFGEVLIQASKYEELRKQSEVWDMFTAKAKEQGLEHFNIIIAQEVVYNSLSPSYRDLFVEVDLAEPDIPAANVRMIYDKEARYLYYHILE